MPRLCAISTAVPRYQLRQDQAREFAFRIFRKKRQDVDRLLPIFENSGINTRYFSMPLDWFETRHSLEEKNDIYIQTATKLGQEVSTGVLAAGDVSPDQIDAIFYVNTTGLATPSIDARLVNLLGLRRNIRRTPIWGLGCAGGAAGLSRAFDYLIGHPSHRVLVVAVELCGLTFMYDDYSKSNFVACALFGEGAAAALLCGDDVPSAGPNITAVQSHFYPDSLDIMGWNIVSEGMQVVFNRRIPDIVADNAAGEIDSFLAENNLARNNVDQFLLHPGGSKVITAYESALGLNSTSLDQSRRVLYDYGNMSSVTVLFVIERFLKSLKRDDSGHALISALGPGFCSESLLLRY